VDAQIALLEKYKRSKLDFLGSLTYSLAQRISLQFNVPEVLVQTDSHCLKHEIRGKKGCGQTDEGLIYWLGQV